MSQRVDQTGQSSIHARKVTQSNGKPAKSASKKLGASEPMLRTPSAAISNSAAMAVANFVASLSPDDRRRMIAEAAYYRAERRGFCGGSEFDDWLAAETEIDKLLSS